MARLKLCSGDPVIQVSQVWLVDACIQVKVISFTLLLLSWLLPKASIGWPHPGHLLTACLTDSLPGPGRGI